MTKTSSRAEAKGSLSATIKDVDEKYNRFAITKKGVSNAVLLSSKEFGRFFENIDIVMLIKLDNGKGKRSQEIYCIMNG